MKIRRTSSARVAALCGLLALTGAAAPDPPAAELAAAVAALQLDPAQVKLWSEGHALEERESFAASNQHYEVLANAYPKSAFLAWHVARNHWRRGERLPIDAKDERR